MQMGGNALKHLNVGRLDYCDFVQRLGEFNLHMIKFEYGNLEYNFRYGIPIPLKNKETFGDLDCVYTCSTKSHEKLISYLTTAFNSKGYKQNGNVRSIEWNGFQVDMIYTEPDAYDWT